MPLLSLQNYELSQPSAVMPTQDEILRAKDGRPRNAGPQVDPTIWPARVRQGFKRLFRDIQDSDAQNLDNLIDGLATWELDLGIRLTADERKLAEMRRTLERATRSSGSPRPSFLRELSTVVQKLEEMTRAASEVQKLYRDGRWQLMAMRAELEDDGDAPVFDDVDAMLDHVLA